MNTRLVELTAIILLLLVSACGGGAQASSATPSPDRFPIVPPLATVAPFPTVAPLATVVPLANTAGQPTTASTAGRNTIDHYVMALNTQGSERNPAGETIVFAPDHIFHLIVAIKDAPKNTKYKVTWYASDVSSTANPLGHYELSAEGSRNLDFPYRPPAHGAAEGAYHVEIDVNGRLAYNVPFSVSSTAAVPAASGDMTATPAAVAVSFIDQVTLAKDARSDTYEPIDPTDTFASNDPYIHFVVHLKDAPAQTDLKATLLQDDVIELATISATTPDAGSRFADFRFTPPTGGWETGDYSVVLYVNDQLNQSVTFTVK
jgi:hypothetical protein